MSTTTCAFRVRGVCPGRNLIVTSLACLLGWLVASPACHAGMMRLLPLQQPTNAVRWEPWRISPNGRWVGGSFSDAQGMRHGVVWRDLSVVYTVSPSGDAQNASITDVNDFGIAIGNFSGPGWAVSGFVASSSGTRVLDGFSGMPNQSRANAINNNGRIVGQAVGGPYRDVFQSAVWEVSAGAGSPINLHYALGFEDRYFGLEGSFAEAVTEAGQVLGGHSIPGQPGRGYLANSDLTMGFHGLLGNPPVMEGHITATSSHGDGVAGFRYAVADTPFAQGLHTNSDEAFANGGFFGTWTNLSINPMAVNDKGIVVGPRRVFNDAFIYANQTYTQLDFLLSQADRYLINQIRGASDITNQGLIAVQTDSPVGYLLAESTPVPEPSVTVMFLLGTTSVLFIRRRRRAAD